MANPDFVSRLEVVKSPPQISPSVLPRVPGFSDVRAPRLFDPRVSAPADTFTSPSPVGVFPAGPGQDRIGRSQPAALTGSPTIIELPPFRPDQIPVGGLKDNTAGPAPVSPAQFSLPGSSPGFWNPALAPRNAQEAAMNLSYIAAQNQRDPRTVAPVPTQPNPLISNPEPQRSSPFEGSYTDPEGNVVGMLRGGGSRVMTPDEVSFFDEANRAAGQPIIYGVTGTGPAPDGMTKTINPITGEVVAADPTTAASFAQRELDTRRIDQEAHTRFIESPEARRMSNEAIREAYVEQAAQDAKNAERESNIRQTVESAPNRGSGGYFGSQSYLRDMSGQNGKMRQLKAMEEKERNKTQDERRYREILTQGEREFAEQVDTRRAERDDARRREDMESRMNLQRLENEGYSQSAITRTNESIRLAQEKARIEIEEARNRLIEEAPPEAVEKFNEVVTAADARLNVAMANFNAAMQVDRKAMADKRLELIQRGTAPDLIEADLGMWVKKQKESDDFRKRAMVATKELEEARDQKNTIIGYYTNPRFLGSYPSLLSQQAPATATDVVTALGSDERILP